MSVRLHLVGRQISRLILVLMLATFALPAMGAVSCHYQSAAMADMTMPSSVPPAAPHGDRKAVMSHACLGCIPPDTLSRASLSEPLPRIGPPPIETAAHFDAARAGPPATPPPRPNA